MRDGALLVTSPRANHVNLNYIVRKLEKCSDANKGGCDDCEDIGVCVRAYDKRCDSGEYERRLCFITR